MNIKYASVKGNAICFPVWLKNGQELIRLNNFDCTMETDNPEIQAAIEASTFFKSGAIAITRRDGKEVHTADTEQDASEAEVSGGQVYADVTDVNGAAETLKTIYGIAPITLRTPERVREQAKKLGVTFPNWK
jgi:hypothetical protein